MKDVILLTYLYIIFGDLFLNFPPFLQYGKKINFQEKVFLLVFENCIPFCSRFSPNFTKFAIKCDRNSKTSQKVHNLRCFLNWKMGFFEKEIEFFKMAICGKLAVEWVTNGTISRKCFFLALKKRVFRKKIRKLFKLKKLQQIMQMERFLEGKICVFFFYKSSPEQNWEAKTSRLLPDILWGFKPVTIWALSLNH